MLKSGIDSCLLPCSSKVAPFYPNTHNCMWHLVDPQLYLGNQRCLNFSPILGMYNLPTITTVGVVFKDTDLRDKCIVRTSGLIMKLKPVRPYILVNFKILVGDGRVLNRLRQALYKTYKTSLAYLTCPLSIWSALSLSLVSLCPSFTEVNFRFHLGNFRGFKSTIYDSGRQSIVFKSRCNCP